MYIWRQCIRQWVCEFCVSVHLTVNIVLDSVAVSVSVHLSVIWEYVVWTRGSVIMCHVCDSERGAMLFASNDNADDEDDDLFALMSKSSRTAKSVSDVFL